MIPERRVGSIWGMTENKSMIFLVRSAQSRGEAQWISPTHLGAAHRAELLISISIPILSPPLCQPKRLCSHPSNQTELLPAGRENKVAGYFSGWDQLPDLVLHISEQTLPLAAGRASGGKWKKQLGVEEGGDVGCESTALQGCCPCWGCLSQAAWGEEQKSVGCSSIQQGHPAAESSHAH